MQQGLRANAAQFALLMLINAFVGGMAGLERTVVPLLGTETFGLVLNTLVVSFIVSFGVVKACMNLVSGVLADRYGRKRLLVLGWLVGLPVPFLLVLVIGALATLLVRRTRYGQELLAVGQSRRAAYLAGIDVRSTILFAYVISGALAALTGALLAASVGSADMELGNPFLLTSVGAVVLGGNRIAGGTATVVGTVLGAILLTLLVTAVTVVGLPIEAKNIARGLVITLVLVMANAPVGQRGGALRRFLPFWQQDRVRP